MCVSHFQPKFSALFCFGFGGSVAMFVALHTVESLAVAMFVAVHYRKFIFSV